WVERAFGHLTRANDTLRDPVERVRYREAVEDGGGTPEADRKLEAMLDAAMEFRKVEVLTRQRRYADAAALLAPILAAAPEEADYHAMMAMLLFEQHGATGRSEAEAILRYADEALRLAPAHERGLFTRGIALKQQGKMREAVSCFRRIVEANPKHTDAARELRLAQMRGDDKKGSGNWKSAKNGGGKSGERDRGGEPGGLLSKLFRKK
ncbi:MAG: tetratricopeptide repeat protein, partial [Myxococcales bacterium]|nr:tetratricopeptide repeat protein [Myxococcales bacterium]